MAMTAGERDVFGDSANSVGISDGRPAKLLHDQGHESVTLAARDPTSVIAGPGDPPAGLMVPLAFDARGHRQA